MIVTTRLGEGDEAAPSADDAGGGGEATPYALPGGVGAKIRQMQQCLGVPQTGNFDDATKTALTALQQAGKLEPTGLPDADTVKLLQRQCGGAMSALSWWDWTVIYAVEYRWWLLGGAAVFAGVGVGVGYSIYRKRRNRR